jgi:hypothetical protein
VADGTRTHDHLDHNQGLYQLSYRHLVRSQNSRPRAAALPALAHERPPSEDEPMQVIMAARSAAGLAAAVRLGGFEPPTRGLEGRRSVR